MAPLTHAYVSLFTQTQTHTKRQTELVCQTHDSSRQFNTNGPRVKTCFRIARIIFPRGYIDFIGNQKLCLFLCSYFSRYFEQIRAFCKQYSSACVRNLWLFVYKNISAIKSRRKRKKQKKKEKKKNFTNTVDWQSVLLCALKCVNVCILRIAAFLCDWNCCIQSFA